MQGIGRTVTRNLKDAEDHFQRIEWILRKGHDQTHEHGGRDEIASATAGANLIPKAGATGTLASSWLPITMYQGTIVKTQWKVWNNTGTTVIGLVLLYPTNDGLVGGTALFTNIYSIQVTAEFNAGSPIEIALASVLQVSADKKQVTVGVVRGTTVGAFPTDTVIAVPDGTLVYCTIIGD